MRSFCQGMDQEPREHPAVLQGDIHRLGSFQLPSASSPGRLSLPTTSHSKGAVAQIRFCKQKSCQLIRR